MRICELAEFYGGGMFDSLCNMSSIEFQKVLSNANAISKKQQEQSERNSRG